jgi:prepilin-type N-terminal cleavage/methylation domain-containing protein
MESVMQSNRHSGRRGFTLFEMITSVLIIGVIGAMVVPAVMATTGVSGLRTASNMLASDVEYVESACISMPQSMRVLRIDVAANKYWIAAASNPDMPIASPADGQPYANDFATGRSARLSGVKIQSVAGAGNGTSLTVAFDAYGLPRTGGSNVVIILTASGGTMTITIDGTTGELTITG